MQHLLINTQDQALETWNEAFPGLRVMQRNQPLPAAVTGDVLWCRLAGGEDVAAVLGKVHADGRPLVLLADDPEDAVVVQAMEAGAAGCCNSRAAPEVLQQVALVVGNGGLWVGQSLLQRLVGSTARILGQRPEMPRNDDWAGKLSERERQVARLVAGGSSNKEIADKLAISERTVKAHLTAVFEKLALRDRLQLSLKINGLQS